MEQPAKAREPVLWWIAGADSQILRQCPRGDQIFVQHLGVSLIGAFVFVFSIATISILIAFPDLASSRIGMVLAPGFAFLIASMVFLIDRLFIQYDWDVQAANQKRELARARWEETPIEDRITTTHREGWFAKSNFLRRYLFLIPRLVLSFAIGLTLASFLELVIYKEEIHTWIHRLHYEENRQIYDEIKARTDALDREIALARTERDRFALLKANTESELDKLELTPPPLPSDRNTADLDAQTVDLRKQISEEEAKVKKYQEDMVAEQRGTIIHQGNSGLVGFGPKYQTALDLKSLAESSIVGLRNKISDLETQKRRVLANRDAEYEAATKQLAERKSALRKYLEGIASDLAGAQQKFLALDGGRASAIEEFVATLKKKPEFIALSVGIASQFRSLRTLYNNYGATFELYMIKLLIILIEMTPVLQKVFLSPSTLYAVKLDSAKRTVAYEHFDYELTLRQQHLRRKADAAMDEALDGHGIKRARDTNITPIHEGRGGS